MKKLHRKLPKTESLKDCILRTLPFYTGTIKPDAIDKGKNVLIASSENALKHNFRICFRTCFCDLGGLSVPMT